MGFTEPTFFSSVFRMPILCTRGDVELQKTRWDDSTFDGKMPDMASRDHFEVAMRGCWHSFSLGCLS